MTELAAFERQVMALVGSKLHARLERVGEAALDISALGDPEDIADAMVAVVPGHLYDEISGPFYDTAGLTRWLGISRQALHQKAARHTVLACPLADGGHVFPAWQFLPSGATIPALGEVLAALAAGTDDTWVIALWMQAPSDALDGQCPSEWLRAGRDPHQVIKMARHAAAGWAA